jgi:hypothetical protein
LLSLLKENLSGANFSTFPCTENMTTVDSNSTDECRGFSACHLGGDGPWIELGALGFLGKSNSQI